MREEAKPSGAGTRIRKITETVKSVLLTLLFISMTSLACIYIVRTQRMTLESAETIDIDRMLTLRSGDDSFITGFSPERVLPECVAVKVRGKGRAAMGGRSILAGALTLLSEPLCKILDDSTSVIEVPEDDADAVWLACCSVKDSVYIRFRSPLPSPILRMYISGGNSAETETASSYVCSISEMFILPGDPADDEKGIRYCRAVARDDTGRTMRFDGEGLTIDITSVISYSANSEFSDFIFAGDPGNDSYIAENPKLKPSAVVTFGESPQLCAVFTEDATDRISRNPEPLLTFMGYNMSRISKYDDPETGAVVYIETWGNLRISQEGISFSATGQRGGIDVSRWLPYGRAGGTYTVYELLHCAENFISGLSSIDQNLTGGDGQLYLRDLYINEEDEIIVSYRFIFDGIDIIRENKSIDISFGGGMIKSVNIRPIAAENQLTRLMNLSMARYFEGKASAASSGTGRISLIYPAENAGEDEQISARWAFVTDKGNILSSADIASPEEESDAELSDQSENGGGT